MRKFLKTRGGDLAIATIGLTVLMTDLAWAPPPPPLPALPGVAGSILAGGAIIGTIVISKLLRRK